MNFLPSLPLSLHLVYLTFNRALITPAKRPPVEETAAFLRTLLENHGANYLEKLFGSNARNALLPLGGPEKVAIALSGNKSSSSSCSSCYFFISPHACAWIFNFNFIATERVSQWNASSVTGSTWVCIVMHFMCCFCVFHLSTVLCIPTLESETLEDFGKALHLMRADLEHLRNVFMAVESGDLTLLRSLGIKDNELADLKFFLDKMVNTGFMDWLISTYTDFIVTQATFLIAIIRSSSSSMSFVLSLFFSFLIFFSCAQRAIGRNKSKQSTNQQNNYLHLRISIICFAVNK